MANSMGNAIRVTLFGESHGACVGCVLDGIVAGTRIDEAFIKERMKLRKADGMLSTARIEDDEVRFLSGVKDGYAQGSPITIVVENTNVRRKDYEQDGFVVRPSHADYVAYSKYDGFHDLSGGGHFSGRLTAPLVVVGAICESMLASIGIHVLTHVEQLGIYRDRCVEVSKIEEEKALLESFAVLDQDVKRSMVACIEEVKKRKDSIGAKMETVVVGMPVGVGSPFFDTLEGNLAKAMFAIPAIKGVEFGLGFGFLHEYGSSGNDAFVYEGEKVLTKTNHNGGILGGISTGMPIVMKTIVKPTPSIGVAQESVDVVKKENVQLIVNGRHDPCIASRFAMIQSSMTCFVLCDVLQSMYGEGYWHG